MRILLVGTGFMAKEYARVLQGMNVGFDIVGRGKANCDLVKSEFPSVQVFEGGLETLRDLKVYTHAVVASSIGSLAPNVKFLVSKDISKILLEKPGGENHAEIAELSSLANQRSLDIFVAYNRRFYASVRKAKEMIAEDGGVTSFNFEFTEWPHVIEALTIDDKIKQVWVLANSTHVIDTAFYLGGKPSEMNTYTAGSLNWHKSAAVFAGAGVSESGALFSYSANWDAPGRWVVEVLTRKRRLIFKPMEKLQVQEMGTVSVNFVEIDDEIDGKYKHGLFLQTESFLTGKYSGLCTIAEQEELVRKFYSRISGYTL